MSKELKQLVMILTDQLGECNYKELGRKINSNGIRLSILDTVSKKRYIVQVSNQVGE